MDVESCRTLLKCFLPDESFSIHIVSNDFTVTVDAQKRLQISKARKKYFIFLLLTQQSNPQSGHWVVCHFDRNKTVEVFNSIGWDPKSLQIVHGALTQLLRLPDFKLVGNVSRVQSSCSSQCGMFCIFYAYQRFVFKRSFVGILRKFYGGENCYLNDRRLRLLEKSLRSRRGIISFHNHGNGSR